ncbi:hypothetical protein [Sedimenticola selenatireducens]|uniref:Uncharacterized protein n=1 Tax=Sedimenticola selenatireducens TaxID=191960 RepID=A0A558DUS0_9GAMM|nr:hypothetical protein [Sedimenticola selenatireducens]TVO72403.1 hypothetical protein FHP88_12450 [Sedimenticola selenatireducens]TVT64658.1 MAG: hypothetical protein FHK78_06215 [Sedimenticola selenatireducens]
MITPLPTDAIEPFIRECLGCRCPAEVFEQIESEVRTFSEIRYQRLLAGRRLLVYLVITADVQALAENVRQLYRQGIRERDRAGYNRLRIVLPDELCESMQGDLIALFAELAAGDEKVHLHFVPQERVNAYATAKH